MDSPLAAEGRRPRVAVVLFSLGAPDGPAAIRPFLMNLFRDPAILRVPFFIRPFLARLIASRRVAPATENYALLGGKSPLLELTQRQADALEAALQRDGLEARCIIAMRYWHPFAAEAVQQVAAFKPDRVLLLPLYPQFSTTTVGSSVADWQAEASKAGLAVDTTTLCCWHLDPGYLEASASIIAPSLARARAEAVAPVRVLFSAHGLPEVIVKKGDPYQSHVEKNAAALAERLGLAEGEWAICYQSRATPQQWLTPSTEEEIERAAHDRVALLVVPIAFVSDHSETLVELDVEYRDVAAKLGVPGYYRAPVQNSDPGFIAALASLARQALGTGPGLCHAAGSGICERTHRDCPFVRRTKA